MRVLKNIFFMLTMALTTVAQSNLTETNAQSNGSESLTVAESAVFISEIVVDPNCIKKNADAINISNTIIQGAVNGCLEVKATEFIDIYEFFDSENGSTFDAQIVSIPGGGDTGGGDTGGGDTGGGDTGGGDTGGGDTGGGDTGGGDTGGGDTGGGDTGGNENKVCENLINHGPANPHLYAHASSNSFVGELISHYAPEYRIEGLTDWKEMSTAGPVKPGSDIYYHYFKEPSDGNEHNIILRTKAGCQEFRDVRNIRVINNTLEEWVALPQNLPSVNPRVQDYYIMVNSEMEYRALGDEIAVYNLWADRVINNLAMRVNGYDYKPFELYTYNLFTVRDNHDMMDTKAIFTKKDFVLDISDDGFETASRYNVYRNYQGGHWSAVSTMTRHDGRVSVSVQGVNWEMNQFLVNVNTGQTYSNINQFGNIFDLGFLGDGTYQFAVKTYHGVTINDRIIVKVKRPSIN